MCGNSGVVTAPQIFVGTRSQYNSLSQKEKESYGLFNITDDMGLYTNNGTLIVSGGGATTISSIPYTDDSCVSISSNLTSQINEELEKQKEDNLSSIEDLKAKLSEYEARIQKLESEVEILKSENPEKFGSYNQEQNSSLMDFF